MLTHTKRYTRWPYYPQYWIQQIMFVQVNPGETLTIRSDDGRIQTIQGPADVPMMSPTGSLPPIYLPYGYTSQVVEENGILKIIIVPQTTDYCTPMPATIQVSQFILPPDSMHPQTPQLRYPPVQVDYPPSYIQECMSQQLQLLPPPPLPPPPPTFIYHEHHEAYSHGIANYNQDPKSPVKMGEHKKEKLKDFQDGGHKDGYMSNNTSLPEHKTDNFSSISGIPSANTVDNTLSIHIVNDLLSTDTVDNYPCTYADDSTSNTNRMDNNSRSTDTMGYTPRTYTVGNIWDTYTMDNVPCTFAVENSLSTYNTDNILSTYSMNSVHTIDNPLSTYTDSNSPNLHIADDTSNNFSTDHVPSISIINTALHTYEVDSVPNSSNFNIPRIFNSPRSSPTDSTHSSSPSDIDPNTPISESIPSTSAIDDFFNMSSTAHISSSASIHIETSYGNKQSIRESGNPNQKPSGKRSKSPLSIVEEKECKIEHKSSCCCSTEKPTVLNVQEGTALISWKAHNPEACIHNRSPATFELTVSNSGKNGNYKTVYIGDEFAFTLLDLQPSITYFVRVTTVRSSTQRTVSEVVSFTTPDCEPDPPLAPKLISRYKSSLNLQSKNSTCNMKGKNNPSKQVKCTACPDNSESPREPYIKEKIHAHHVRIGSAPKLDQLNSNACEVKWETLEPIKGDPIAYRLYFINKKGTNMINKKPNTSSSFSSFYTNSHYHYKTCAGHQYQNSDGIQDLWGPFSPSALVSTHKKHARSGKNSGGKGRNIPNEEHDGNPRIEMSENTFVLIVVIGLALITILYTVAIQQFIVN
ncbi:fibronectin type III domain containing protein 3C1-like [Erinaceus europaeus]|uniref:Fibronectin type III domain containing protein 3C1-like n=1 Tax=Erinaceus europaeus TaxID=9365 RepID=A0ABM3WRS9_ERIEU|nr:fibronectin type III domain containing protein 3C1-like [Erinaceus europaeus]